METIPPKNVKNAILDAPYAQLQIILLVPNAKEPMF